MKPLLTSILLLIGIYLAFVQSQEERNYKCAHCLATAEVSPIVLCVMSSSFQIFFVPR